MALPTIAFLGTGLMGQPMVCRLLQAGYAVTVWNRTAGKTHTCVEHGAVRAASIGHAVRQADVVITMLASGPVVSEVITAAFADLPESALVIDMSSTRQSEACAIHTLLATRGIRFIDAPVSGGVAGAEAGTLAIMVGAAPADFARVQALLTILGTATLVGPPGTGQLTKLCNQLIVGGTLHLVAEALLLAKTGGADPAAARRALRGGFAESKILDVHGQRMLDRYFIPGGQVTSQCKDMENIMDAAQNLHLNLPQAQLVTDVYRRLLKTDPQADHSAALLDLERGNPGVRLSDKKDQLPTESNL